MFSFMEVTWSFVVISLSVCLLIKALFSVLSNSSQHKLPPGPLNIPVFSTFQLHRKGIHNLETTLPQLFAKYGPIVLLRIGSQKSIFIRSHELAYKALITHGSTFSDRPPASVVTRYLSSNQHSIHTSVYGSLWRLLRRNLTSEILHSSRDKSYAPARQWVLDILLNKLKKESNSGTRSVCVVNHFQNAMFCLLVYMCFGEKLDDEVIKQIETSQRELALNLSKFDILNSLPKLGKILFHKRWSLLYKLRRKQEDVLLPLIRACEEKRSKAGLVAYMDTLLNISLPEEGGRRLNDHEIVTLCSEFLNAGTDTTSSALEWIMANLVKNQGIQAKLFNEIKANSGQCEIKADELQKMPYLKAVVLEGLRRHPAGHFVLPHTVTEDTLLDGYVVPKDATVNFMVAEMGRDPKVWEEPMEFRPERFMSSGNREVFDVTGSREIKMMPFGAGRRICPAFGFATLHLEYFVANLIKEFEWTDGMENGVDLSEKTEVIIMMKNPLQAYITPRGS